MTLEQKIGLVLIGNFAIGLVLIAIGLGVGTKLSAFVVGLVLCLATAKVLAGGCRK